MTRYSNPFIILFLLFSLNKIGINSQHGFPAYSDEQAHISMHNISEHSGFLGTMVD